MNDASAPRRELNRQAGSVLGILGVCLLLAIVVIVLAAKVHHLNAQAAKNADAQKQPATATPGVPQAQAPGQGQPSVPPDKSRAEFLQLQAQLDKAKSQQADLQSQLDKAKAQSAGLQSQLDAAKSQSADLQTQLDTSKAQSTDLQAQIGQAATASAQLRAQLDQAKAQAADEESRLQKTEGELARIQPALLRARRLPITAVFEKIHGGPFEVVSAPRGFTLHIVNLYLEPLVVDITIAGPDGAHTQTGTIDGGATLNVVKLAAGEKVIVASEGYDSVTLTVQ